MRKVLWIVPFALILMSLGCQNVNALQTQVDELSKKVTALEQKIEKMSTVSHEGENGEPCEGEKEIAALKKEISSLKKDLADLKSRYESHLKKFHR